MRSSRTRACAYVAVNHGGHYHVFRRFRLSTNSSSVRTVFMSEKMNISSCTNGQAYSRGGTSDMVTVVLFVRLISQKCPSNSHLLYIVCKYIYASVAHLCMCHYLTGSHLIMMTKSELIVPAFVYINFYAILGTLARSIFLIIKRCVHIICTSQTKNKLAAAQKKVWRRMLNITSE